MIPLTRPDFSGSERNYLAQALDSCKVSGNGPFTGSCEDLLEFEYGRQTLLTPSCTAALEMAAILAEVGPGDEVIMPSWTFTSTANAFMLRGAVPVFVDIRPDTLNIDESLIEAAITERTKAIVPVHYAGVMANMEAILEIARRHDLLVIEDSAQAFPCQVLGDMACFSFHETKNIACGEGGAIAMVDRFFERAEIIREKGTNRQQMIDGRADKYTWRDIGSSYVPSELSAAVLLAQLERAYEITERRQKLWQRYHAELKCEKPQHMGNAHIFYALTDKRDEWIARLRENGVYAAFHYVPLHQSPMGKHCRFGDLPVTERIAQTLVRLPLFSGMFESEQSVVIRAVNSLR